MKRLLLAAAMAVASGRSVHVQVDQLAQVRLKPEATTTPAVHVLSVRNSVSMIQTPGGNITVLAFPEGITLVDTGSAEAVDQVLAAIRSLSKQPIRYIINTTFDPGHVGGNDKLGSIGIQITGGNVAGQVGTDGAEIIAHENLLDRMSARTNTPRYPARALPQTTYHVDSIKLSTVYHGDGIQVFHVPAAHTDGDSLVYFRHNDVLATGDVFSTTTYPVIDLEHGGTINGIVDGLNKILDIAFPEFRLEGGTLIVPGHGRVCDSADVAYYRDLVTIIRDRVQDMKRKGMTLEQVKAQRPTRDYDPRYGSGEQFVDAVYKTLK